jgi:SAM-dependent methyltransferase
MPQDESGAGYEALGRLCRAEVLGALPPGWDWRGKRVLDFGCGAGRTLRHFTGEARVAEFWGCDVHQPSIDWLTAQVGASMRPFVNGPEPPLDLASGSFDLIYAVSVFTHIGEKWAGWLVEMHRLLADDGLFCATFLGPTMAETISGKPWDADTTGMNVYGSTSPDGDVFPNVLHSQWWLRAHWGRAFEIVSIKDRGFAAPDVAEDCPSHGWIVLRKRDVTVSAADLEAPEPDEPRELAWRLRVQAEAPAAGRDPAIVQAGTGEPAAAEGAKLPRPRALGRGTAGRLLARRRGSAAVPPASDLRAEHIRAVYRAFLARDATDDEVATWMAGAGSTAAFLDGVLSSTEYEDRHRASGPHADQVDAIYRHILGRPPSMPELEQWLRAPSLDGLIAAALASPERIDPATAGHAAPALKAPPSRFFLNAWIEGFDAYTHPPGTRSPDDSAVIGKRGYVFLVEGSNDTVKAFRGELRLPAGWLREWRALLAERRDLCAARGWQSAFVVIPDKLALYGDCFDGDLSARAPRPVQRLLADGLPILYPAEALLGARETGEVCLRTDTHLTPWGNEVLARAVLAELGCSAELLGDAPLFDGADLWSGDLAIRFEPWLGEFVERPTERPAWTTVRDDLSEGHWIGEDVAARVIGTIQVYRRADAPDQRKIVVFGDSYSVDMPHYHGLSWYLAHAFAEVHFVWVPFGWDSDYVERVGAELIICEIAERFIVRVPPRDAHGLGKAAAIADAAADVLAS